jgi:hypothetical protein
MQFVRTMLAIAIAASLALLPAGAAGSAMGPAGTQSTMQMMQMAAPQGMSMSMDNMSMDECCPDDMKGAPTRSDHGCGMGLCCVGGTIALADVSVAPFTLAASEASQVSIPADQIAGSRITSPPFRPPRV